ncbi:MAG TPA: type I restriction enzyme endonuclease domain-containing protein, partial [Segetibacter sp.]
QYGLIQGFARNLRKAVPNASFIGFTGTPVDSKDADTVSVFGEIIHTYDIRQATEDHAVVPIYYEPRLAKLHLANPAIEEEAEEITTGLNESDRNKVMWAAMEDAAGSAERVEAISKDILTHYLKRISNLEGKAMIVCMSRRNCVKMYDALTALAGCPEVAVIMTTNIAKDPKEWNTHVRTKEAMEAIKARFKDADDPLKIVIVRDMWLTGFDNPSLHTLYVDKIMSGHNLIQAVNRVATVFKDKPSGLIVDYIGIGDRLRDATKKYTGGGGKGQVTIDVKEALEMAIDEVSLLKTVLPKGFDYTVWPSLSKGDQLKLVSAASNHIVADDDICNDFLLHEKRLSSIVPVIKSEQGVEEIALDIIFFQHVAAAVRKVKFPPTPLRKKEQQIKDLIHRSIESDEVIDVFEVAGIERFDISIINDDFLATAKEQKSGNELKLELIRQILEDEIKVRSYKNLIKSKKLKEEVDRIINDYHNHFFDSLIALQKMREVAKEYQDEDVRRRQLGLTEEEEAFYEILAHHKTALQDFELMKELVKEITAVIKKNLKVDWYKKQDLVAMIKKSVKMTLMKKGVMRELQEILDEIMEQVTARYREWEEVAA